MLVALAALFVVAGIMVSSFRGEQRELAQRWLERGRAALAANAPEQAIEAFRTALVYERDDPSYLLQLAQALIAGERYGEARAYLLTLWEREPGNGEVNLALGRLAARDGDVAAVQRYYHGAVYGSWEETPEQKRREARWELVQVLLENRARPDAQAELISLVADLPRDPGAHVRAAVLLREAGARESALQEYERALTLDEAFRPALTGAADTALLMEDYGKARHYLLRAAAQAPLTPQEASSLRLASAVIALDPFASGVTSVQRRRRALELVDLARARLAACADTQGLALPSELPRRSRPLPPTPEEGPQHPLLQLNRQLLDLRPKATDAALRRDPDQVDAVLNLAFAAERQAAEWCGPAEGRERALEVLARRHKESNRP